MSKACTLSIYALLLLHLTNTVHSLDEDAFQRIFNSTSLSTEQITEIAELYNIKVQEGTAKKSVLNRLNELFNGTAKERKNIRKLFVGMWSDELLLRKLSNESFANIQDLIDPNLQTKINERRQQADKKYGGDFAKAQLDAVRFAVQSVPASKKVKLQEELDKPLKGYNSTFKRQRLVKAIERFQVDEKNSTAKQ